MALEGNIAIGAEASIPTPPAGEVTRFFNTAFSPPVLYYKDENGDIYPWPTDVSDEADCCACEIAKDMISKISCALKDGMMTATEYESIIKQGVSITAASTDDGHGNKTCNVNLGPAFIAPTSVTVSPLTINPLSVGNQRVVVPTVLPANATIKTGVWTSSNPAVATVDSNGVVTAASAGVASITFITSIGNFSASCAVTVV